MISAYLFISKLPSPLAREGGPKGRMLPLREKEH
jgi:hypothetical protein